MGSVFSDISFTTKFVNATCVEIIKEKFPVPLENLQDLGKKSAPNCLTPSNSSFWLYCCVLVAVADRVGSQKRLFGHLLDQTKNRCNGFFLTKSSSNRRKVVSCDERG